MASPRRARRLRPWTWIVGVVLLVAVLVSAPSGALDLGLLLRVDPRWTAAALVAYAASYAARALRFAALLPRADRALPRLFGVVAAHNLANMLLPARSGELSFLWLAQRRLGHSLAAAAGALLAARLLDVVAIAAFFLGACALRGVGTGDNARGAAGLLLLGLVLLLLLPVLLEATARRLAATDGSHGSSSGRRRRLADALDRLAPATRRARAPAALSATLVQWCATFSTVLCLVRSAGTVVDISGVVLGATGLSLALILPLNVTLNVGTFEAGWVLGFRLAGLDGAAAVRSALVAHTTLLVFAVLLALPSWRLVKATTSAHPPPPEGGRPLDSGGPAA